MDNNFTTANWHQKQKASHPTSDPGVYPSLFLSKKAPSNIWLLQHAQKVSMMGRDHMKHLHWPQLWQYATQTKGMSEVTGPYEPVIKFPHLCSNYIFTFKVIWFPYPIIAIPIMQIAVISCVIYLYISAKIYAHRHAFNFTESLGGNMQRMGYWHVQRNTFADQGLKAIYKLHTRITLSTNYIQIAGTIFGNCNLLPEYISDTNIIKSKPVVFKLHSVEPWDTVQGHQGLLQRNLE